MFKFLLKYFVKEEPKFRHARGRIKPLGVTNVSGFVWSMKKADGTLQHRFTAHGCIQKDGTHYNSSLVYDPVKNDTMISITLMLMLKADGETQVMDVESFFLHGVTARWQ